MNADPSDCQPEGRVFEFNGIAAATAYLSQVGGEGAISLITRAEVLCGFDAAAADLAANLRRSYRWRLPDAFEAARAQLHGLTLATRNVRDFPPARFDFVEVPYRVRPSSGA